MKKIFALTLALLMALTLCCCAVPGGWQKAKDGTVTPELAEKLEKASNGYCGMGFVPKKLLETQVVSGTNYKILCDGTTVTRVPETHEVIVVVYEDLQGNCSIISVTDADQ